MSIPIHLLEHWWVVTVFGSNCQVRPPALRLHLPKTSTPPKKRPSGKAFITTLHFRVGRTFSNLSMITLTANMPSTVCIRANVPRISSMTFRRQVNFGMRWSGLLRIMQKIRTLIGWDLKDALSGHACNTKRRDLPNITQVNSRCHKLTCIPEKYARQWHSSHHNKLVCQISFWHQPIASALPSMATMFIDVCPDIVRRKFGLQKGLSMAL
jgi:hypothetical protein